MNSELRLQDLLRFGFFRLVDHSLDFGLNPKKHYSFINKINLVILFTQIFKRVLGSLRHFLKFICLIMMNVRNQINFVWIQNFSLLLQINLGLIRVKKWVSGKNHPAIEAYFAMKSLNLRIFCFLEKFKYLDMVFEFFWLQRNLFPKQILFLIGFLFWSSWLLKGLYTWIDRLSAELLGWCLL